MNKIVGFIGGGNMARAIIGGILNAELISKENIIASARSQETVDYL